MYPNKPFFEEVAKWELIQLRLTPELKEGIHSWCRRRGLNVSCYTRMVYARTLENDHAISDPRMIQPIANAVRDVQDYLPVMGQKSYAKY